MSWFIFSAYNNGYPWNDSFPTDFNVGFVSGVSGVQYPYSLWRIGSGVNNGYPWKYWWFETGTTDNSDMVTGGNQTNYPDGFTTGNTGGLTDQFNDDDMGFNDDLVEALNTVIKGALAEKIMGLSISEYQRLISYINDPSHMGPNFDPNTIQKLYGANIFDGVLLCKMYPFDVFTDELTSEIYPKIFGIYRLYSTVENPPGSGTYEPVSGTGYYVPQRTVRAFNMGSISPNVLQAWELEGVSYYIYLPCAGTFPIDVRDGSEISITLWVDLLSGIGEYFIKQNGQIIGNHKIMIGIDVPMNFSQGQTQANYTSFVTSQISRAAGIAAGIAGGINPLAGAALGAVSAGVGQMAGHFDVSSPSVGGCIGWASYPFARIIAKIPKMFNDGYGYPETQGLSRETTYTALSDVSGFVQCANYKSDIIIATEDEKREIENLMNGGVFL